MLQADNPHYVIPFFLNIRLYSTILNWNHHNILLYLPPRAVCKDAQILLDRNEGLHGVCLWFHHAAALLVIDAHRILIGWIVGIALDATIAAIDHNATAEVRTRFYLDFGCMRQTLCGMGRD